MKFLATANDTGSVKEIICNRGTDTSKKDGLQPKSVKNFCKVENLTSFRTKITHLIDFHSTYLIGARVGGSVSVFEFTHDESIEDEDKYKSLHTYKLDVEPTDKPVGLIQIDALDSVIVAYESSKVFLIHFQGDGFDYKPIYIQLPTNKQVTSFVENPYKPGIFAYGGKENDLRIVQLYEESATAEIFEDDTLEITAKTVFSAKNVPNDHLDLRVRVWISRILFFEKGPENGEGYKLITATRYGQLRLYDTTIGQEPLKDYMASEKAIVAMTFGDEAQETVIITDVHSLIAKFSLRKIDEKASKIHSASAGDIIRPAPKLLGKFSQGLNTGATHALVNSEDEVLVTGGLDRYLRVFDIETRAILAKVYLGVEISSVLVLDLDDEEEQVEEGQEKKPTIQRKRRRDIEKAEESDEEELWNQLEGSDKKTKKS